MYDASTSRHKLHIQSDTASNTNDESGQKWTSQLTIVKLHSADVTNHVDQGEMGEVNTLKDRAGL